MNYPKLRYQFWEKLYDLSWLVFRDMPITWSIKHKMNMAYVAWQLYTKKKDK